jgi:uncharacterized SAM-binding protein YcdF (DUF218 family)
MSTSSSSSEVKLQAERPRRRSRRWTLIGLLVGLTSSAVIGLWFSPGLLTVQHLPAKADVIVVLGGDSTYRPARALELYQSGLAPRILISGNGDCEEVLVALVGKGVPRDHVDMECDSRTTRENALLCAPRLRALSARQVILVTSWFHSRRALRCFQHYMPEIDFVSLPTAVDRPTRSGQRETFSGWPEPSELRPVLLEYLKVIYYWGRFGVSPW